MRLGRMVGLALALALLTHGGSSARAEVIDGVELSVDGGGATLELTTPQGLRAPRLRMSAGMVRLWFPNVVNDPRVERRGDGAAIRWVKVWPGMNGSSAVQIRLGDARRLADDDVQIQHLEGRTLVHIPASALPAPRTDAPAATDTHEDAAPAATDTHEDAAPADASDAADTTDAPSDDAPAQAAHARAAAPAQTTSPRAAGLAPQPAPGSSGFVVMLLITVLLGSVYGVIRLLARRRSPQLHSAIEVVSSKRLGPRHQLVVVRALGEDHLLSINRGETERLASAPSLDEPVVEAPSSTESAGDLLSKIREGLGLRIAEPAPAPAPEPEPKLPLDDGGRFGSQLMRAAAAASYGGSRPKSSEAVAGLMRLRERAQR